MNVFARGLGDPEAYLTKVHGVRPPHLGKQAVARWYLPPEIDYRLECMPRSSNGLIVWVMEAKVLSRNELQFFALLPAIQPRVKVVAEMGSARKVTWKPLTDVCGLPLRPFPDAVAVDVSDGESVAAEVVKDAQPVSS
eukprot:SM000009S23554  [mRNA]  locus=s9:698291:699618:+ [translate_table: standard]